MHEHFFRTGLMQALSMLSRDSFLARADEALRSVSAGLALLSPGQCSAIPSSTGTRGLPALGTSWAHGRERGIFLVVKMGRKGERLSAVSSEGRLLITLWALTDVCVSIPEMEAS